MLSFLSPSKITDSASYYQQILQNTDQLKPALIHQFFAIEDEVRQRVFIRNLHAQQVVLSDYLPDAVGVLSILKSTADGEMVIIRLRSVSNKDETVKLSWTASNPRSVNLCEIEEVPGRKVNNDVIVPANGLITLKATW